MWRVKQLIDGIEDEVKTRVGHVIATQGNVTKKDSSNQPHGMESGLLVVNRV